MSKLFKLKKWITLSEAANHLSGVFAEPVSIADIYRFALDRHLVLSVDFVNHARAQLGRIRTIEEADIMVVPGIDRMGKVDADTIRSIPRRQGRDAIFAWAASHKELFDSGDLVFLLAGDRLDDDRILDFEHKLSTLSGLWDLPMIGGESLDITHALQRAIGGPEVELINLDGTLVVNPNTGQYAKLLAQFDDNEYADKTKKREYNDFSSYYPAGGLPNDSSVVVRTGAISDFIQALTEEAGTRAEKALASRERHTLLRVICALSKEAGIKIHEGSGGAAAIEAAVVAAGFDGPKEKAIRAILSDVRSLTA